MAKYTLTEEDLRLEMWLREREQGKLVWETKDGQKIPLKDMSDSHLQNALNKLIECSEMEDIKAEFDSFSIKK